MARLPLILILLAPQAAMASELPTAIRPLGSCASLASGPAFEPGALEWSAYGQLFAGFDQTFVEDDDFNAFDLGRAELGACVGYGGHGGLVLGFEAIRSAGAESLFGVDGNSLVARLKHAAAFMNPTIGPGELTVFVGLIPDPWVQRLDARYDIRATAPLLAERGRFFDTSDLGASVGYDLMDGLASLTVAYTNGEGRNQVELNSGKNLTIVAATEALRLELFGSQATFGLHGGYRDASLGFGNAANHRIFGALTAVHPRATVGVEYTRALGYLGRTNRDASGLGAWLTAVLVDPYLGMFARFDHLVADEDGASNSNTRVSIGAFTDLLPQRADARLRLRAYAAYVRETFDVGASPLPGVSAGLDLHAVTVLVEASGFSADGTKEEHHESP